MKTIYQLPLFLILSSITQAEQAGDNLHVSNGRFSQGELISIVLRDNPTVKASRAKWEMMKARVPQARAWEDLRAGGEFRVERSVSVPPNSFMDQTAMLEQEVPISGKNLSRGRAATAEARAAFEDFRRTKLDAVMRARSAYARLANGYAQLEVNRRNTDLLDQFVQISRNRYETGAATQADVLIAQTDAAKLQETRADLERQISEAQSALNVLMNRPAQAALGQPAEPAFAGRTFSLRTLQNIALAQRPELQRAQARLEAERFRVQLARRQSFPDPALNVKAQRYNDAAQAVSEVDVGVSFPVPWLNWKKSIESASHELEAARTETLGLVRDQLKKVETAAHHYEIYRDNILPLATQTVDASRAAYEANTGGFLQLITARRTLQDAESAALNHLADYEIALAELDAIVGGIREDQK